MSECKNCKTKFKFMGVLKTLNPAKIKCSGCEEHIESSYLILILAVVIYSVSCILFWFSPMSDQRLTGAPMLVFLAV